MKKTSNLDDVMARLTALGIDKRTKTAQAINKVKEYLEVETQKTLGHKAPVIEPQHEARTKKAIDILGEQIWIYSRLESSTHTQMVLAGRMGLLMNLERCDNAEVKRYLYEMETHLLESAPTNLNGIELALAGQQSLDETVRKMADKVMDNCTSKQVKAA